MNPAHQNEKAPVAAGAFSVKARCLKPTTKKAAMVKAFLQAGDKGMNCFEAVHRCRDYVLRTTVSELQRHYGLIFQRQFEQVPNAFGTKTDCMRYWLDPESRDRARELLGEAAHV